MAAERCVSAAGAAQTSLLDALRESLLQPGALEPAVAPTSVIEVVVVEAYVSPEPVARNSCGNAGGCVDHEEFFTCECAAGWTGTVCQTVVDECASYPCRGSSICTDQLDGYACVCPAGWQGEHCEVDVDECASEPCLHGDCTDSSDDLWIPQHLYSCACTAGWAGDNCDTDVDECGSVPCESGGGCTDGVDQYICACTAGYAGENCAINVDECASTPCVNAGRCLDGVAGYACDCVGSWSGENCEANVDRCESAPCQNGGSCTDQFLCVGLAACENIYTCTCGVGFRGHDCEEDINECNAKPCSGHGTCYESASESELYQVVAGSYTCDCSDGWTGDRCATEVSQEDEVIEFVEVEVKADAQMAGQATREQLLAGLSSAGGVDQSAVTIDEIKTTAKADAKVQMSAADFGDTERQKFIAALLASLPPGAVVDLGEPVEGTDRRRRLQAGTLTIPYTVTMTVAADEEEVDLAAAMADPSFSENLAAGADLGEMVSEPPAITTEVAYTVVNEFEKTNDADAAARVAALQAAVSDGSKLADAVNEAGGSISGVEVKATATTSTRTETKDNPEPMDVGMVIGASLAALAALALSGAAWYYGRRWWRARAASIVQKAEHDPNQSSSVAWGSVAPDDHGGKGRVGTEADDVELRAVEPPEVTEIGAEVPPRPPEEKRQVVDPAVVANIMRRFGAKTRVGAGRAVPVAPGTPGSPAALSTIAEPAEEKLEKGMTVVVDGEHEGVVRYTGLAHFGPGQWIGIAMTLPVGKHDGSVKGMRYFKCRPGHGIFVKDASGRVTARAKEEEKEEEDHVITPTSSRRHLQAAASRIDMNPGGPTLDTGLE
jgi:Notch-like protein